MFGKLRDSWVVWRRKVGETLDTQSETLDDYGETLDEYGETLDTYGEKLDTYNPVAKTEEMTSPVGVDNEGKLWSSGGGGGGGILEEFWSFNPKATINLISQTKIDITTQQIGTLYSPKIGDQFILKYGDNEMHMYVSKMLQNASLEVTSITLMYDPRGLRPTLGADTDGLNAFILFESGENTYLTEDGFTFTGDNLTGRVGSRNQLQISLI